MKNFKDPFKVSKLNFCLQLEVFWQQNIELVIESVTGIVRQMTSVEKFVISNQTICDLTNKKINI